jgi:hypothetical protein
VDAPGRAEAYATAERILDARDRSPGGIRPDHAAEALLLARWFRLRPDELARTRRADPDRIARCAHVLGAITVLH